ncbi:GNAT family N-acetyltransferase [Chitinophaga caeni]|uniref:GNAT family N-acetyltransferase n=1 Tax=Chitinophaga caeni TaxID=2029983 RepID=A0A291R1H8_9BACT|nr:GNAT family N-acetyltransferase [Chitinophaga caeni]ATL49992.1 GNAT family N-acetyltransferase [Chitinophaga caeni]
MSSLLAFPVLQTARLSLVPINPKHLEDIFKLFSDTRVTQFYNLHPFRQLHEAQHFIDYYAKRFQEQKGVRWGITIQGATKLIGTVGFNHFTPNHRSNIGYDLHPDYWNKGFMTEALKRVIQFGMEQLQVNRIEAEVMPGNTSSIKVLEKLGFYREAMLKDWMYFDQKHFDMYMFVLLRKKYEAMTIS